MVLLLFFFRNVKDFMYDHKKPHINQISGKNEKNWNNNI